METTPKKNQLGPNISIWAALGGMVVTFLIGIYVGIHPNWIPIRSSMPDDFSSPTKVAMPAPTTEPGEVQRPAATQPEAIAH